jgi:hypothetical protein
MRCDVRQYVNDPHRCVDECGCHAVRCASRWECECGIGSVKGTWEGYEIVWCIVGFFKVEKDGLAISPTSEMEPKWVGNLKAST